MKIAILGYGKLGKTIDALLLNSGHEVVLKVTSSNPLHASDLGDVDVAIEVSTPETAVQHITICLESGVPVVIGTTGWYHSFAQLEALCQTKNGSMLHATNFSVGVNLFFEMNKKLAQWMHAVGGYEPSLLEIHHTEKKDAPSGTGISLANDLIQHYPSKKQWVNALNEKADDLALLSQRVADEPGTHVVTYVSDVDSISMVHKAQSREGFARGAIRAAEWIMGRPGVHTMRDFLGLDALV